MKKLLVLICLIVPLTAFASWEGKVVKVADGDTITVLSNGSTQVRIRFYGIDAPERRQDFGTRAKQYVSDMVFNKTVRLEPMDVDRYGRTVALVFIEGKCVNEALIREGFAWVYTEYCTESFCAEWERLESEARSNRTGIWGVSDPVSPWDFRHAQAEETARQQERDAKPGFQILAWAIIFVLAAGLLALIRFIQIRHYIKRKRKNPDSNLR